MLGFLPGTDNLEEFRMGDPYSSKEAWALGGDNQNLAGPGLDGRRKYFGRRFGGYSYISFTIGQSESTQMLEPRQVDF
jgi:hypothetical protein